MNAQSRYQCSRCNEVHEFYFDAEECCAPEIWDVFACESCGEVYDKKDTAEDCCGDQPETPIMYQKRIERLEALGQLRLCN